MDGPTENKMNTHTRGITKGKARDAARKMHPAAHVQFDDSCHPKSPCRVGYFNVVGRFIDRAGGATWPEALERAQARLPKGGRL